MNRITVSQVVLVMATLLFVGFMLLSTVFWPLDDYGNFMHSYAEGTHRIVRSMSVGVTAYLSVLGMVLAVNLTKREATS